MKALLLSLIIGVSSLHIASGQIILFNLGTSSYDISTSAGIFSQNGSSVGWQGNMQSGDLVAGGILSGPLNLSLYTTPPWQFGIQMSVVGTDPNTTFTAEFFDSNINSASYSGSTPTISGGIAPLIFSSLSDPSFNYADIIGFQFTWTGSGGQPLTSLTATNVLAIPEPTTILLFTGSLGLLSLRQRRRAR